MASIGCRQLTAIDAPDLVDPSALGNASGAEARYAGAISDFASAYAVQVEETGLIADEFQDAGNDPFSPDRRIILPINSYPFAELGRARISALRAIATLERVASVAPQRVGELYTLVGYVETALAENMCSPVPLATVADGIPVEAPQYDREALLDHALAMFDSATAHAGAIDTILNLSNVGRARALLFRDDVEGAAAAVGSVPQNFEYLVPYSATVAGQINDVYDRIALGKYITVADQEGVNGLTFISGGDARIGATNIGVGRSGRPLYNFAKNAGLGAPIVLASGVEAALIRAEALLRQGDVEAWADVLNDLRLTAISPPLSELPDDSTTSAGTELRIDVLFHERAFWLFGTGHRQGDMRRLIRQYGRNPEATFPTGEYAPEPGVNYGDDVVFTPAGEEPNRSYDGCAESGA